MSDSIYNREQAAYAGEKGNEIYYRILPELREKEYPEGHVVLIDVRTGDYYVAESRLALFHKHPGLREKLGWVREIRYEDLEHKA